MDQIQLLNTVIKIKFMESTVVKHPYGRRAKIFCKL